MGLALKPPTPLSCQATARQPGRRDRPLQPPADRHRPFSLVAHVPRKPQTPKRLGDTPGAATLAPVLAHTLEPRAWWWIDRWPVAKSARVVLWLSQWYSEGPRARSRVRVEGEKRASLLLRITNRRSVWLGSCQSTPSRWVQGSGGARAVGIVEVEQAHSTDPQSSHKLSSD
jgi:hypothetical protein